ncbi:MAG: SRPBCC family protein [Bacteroidales bacterium]|nr:SRPBCC family protein [Bacteroidales bacterium]
MKYTNEIVLALPLNKVIELFDNPENMREWQPGLISFEHLSGSPGEEGAKSKLKYKMGKREVEMVETIVKRDLPGEFTGTYEAKGVFNLVKNSFIRMGPQETKWISENEFRFSGFMIFFAWFMPGAFRKQSRKLMEQFKNFAENR